MHATMVPAVVAGIIEGVVEWLPVSSKTMITLYFSIVGVKVQSAYALGLIANFGSFFAALYYFRTEVWGALKSLRHPFSDEPYAQLLRFVVLGTVATGVIGIPIYLLVQHTFSIVGGSIAMLIIGALLLVTSLIAHGKERLVQKSLVPARKDGTSTAAAGTSALAVERASRKIDGGDQQPSAQSVSSAEEKAGSIAEGKSLTLKTWLITGAAQGLAALPGISRSAVTMTPLLWMGFSAEQSLRLSFLLDVVALVGAGVVPVAVGHGGRAAIAQIGLVPTIVMLVVAAVISFGAIRLVLGLARRLRTSTVTLIIGIITILVPLWAILGSLRPPGIH